VEIQLEPPAPDSPESTRKRLPTWATVCEASVFVVFSVFFILYGQTPLLGGAGLGLVGADEPRYAQIAHEMLNRFDSAHTIKGRLAACVTPYLYGHPWLEKPALYYWQAMLAYSVFGVSDWAARLPSAVDATLMVVAVCLFLRHFRPGFQLDGADNVERLGIAAISRRQRHAFHVLGPFRRTGIGHALRAPGVEQMDMGIDDGDVGQRGRRFCYARP
jgi:hypothetical protein